MGEDEYEVRSFCVGPIWGNYEAASKTTDWLMKNKSDQGWKFTGKWWSKDGTSYASCKRIKKKNVGKIGSANSALVREALKGANSAFGPTVAAAILGGIPSAAHMLAGAASCVDMPIHDTARTHQHHTDVVPISGETLKDTLKSLGLEEFHAAFMKEGYTLDVLPEIEDGELQEMGMKKGHIRRFRKNIPAPN